MKKENFETSPSIAPTGQIVLQNSRNIFVNGCSPKASNLFLRLERNSKNINVVGNNLSAVNIPVFIDETIKTDDLNIASNLTGSSTVFEFLQPNIERDSLGMVSIYYPNNAEINFTTDGSQPTRSSNKYLQEFEQISPTVIKAAAFENNEVSSTATLKLDKAQVISPHISPANQYYNNSIEVKLISNTKGAAVYYTLDGSEPTESSQKYEGNLKIDQSATLSSKAYKNDYKTSDEASAIFKSIEKLNGVQYKYYENKSSNKWEKLPNFLLMKPLAEGTTNKFSYDDIENSGTYFALLLHGFINITHPEGSNEFYIETDNIQNVTLNLETMYGNRRKG